MNILTLYNTDNQPYGFCLVLAFVALLALGCRSALMLSEPPTLQRDQEWQLVEMQGRKIKSGTAPIILVFNPEAGTLRGRMACNTYNADFALAPLTVEAHSPQQWCSLTVSGLESTAVQCPEGVMNDEVRYLAKLRQASQLALADAGNTLIIGNRNKPLLVFELK